MVRSRLVLVAPALLILAQCSGEVGGGSASGGRGSGGSGDSGGSAGTRASGGAAGNRSGGSAGGDKGSAGSGGGNAVGGSSGGGAAGAATAGTSGGPVDPRPVGDPVATCGQYASGNNLGVCSASYVGGANDDSLNVAEVAPDGTIAVAGLVDGTDAGKTPTVLLNGTTGALLRLDSQGKEVKSITRIGKEVKDMEIDQKSGAIAVAGDFGVAVLDAAASKVTWSKSDGAIDRVSIGDDGTVAALGGGKVSVYDASGQLLKSWGVDRAYDVAVHAQSKTVLLGGDRQDDGAPCTQLRIPYLRGYDYAGEQKWKDWDLDKQTYGSRGACADSVIRLVSVGKDGKVYIAAEGHGGNTPIYLDPHNPDAKAPNVQGDKWGSGYNMDGASKLSIILRIDPTNGNVENSGILVGRNSDKGDKGSTIRPKAITADEKGNIFLAHAVGCCIQNETMLSVAGVPSTTKAGPAIIIWDKDFKRLSWNRFSQAGDAEPMGVAVGRGVAAIVATQSKEQTTEGGIQITVNPMQAKQGGGAEGYFAVFPAP